MVTSMWGNIITQGDIQGTLNRKKECRRAACALHHLERVSRRSGSRQQALNQERQAFTEDPENPVTSRGH